MNPNFLPAGVVSGFAGGLQTPQLPPAPPRKKPNLFDRDHRQDTLLAIGAGLLSGNSLGDGVGRAAQNMLGLRQQMTGEQRRTHEYGGPDNSFEIITDPRTGERTVRPVAQFQDYLEDKRTKPKDTADINGRVMFSLQQLPEEQRSAAYANIRANPTYYGVDPSTMPEQYDPIYAEMASGMGMTVSQALTRQRADESADDLERYRAGVQADRQRRTGIYEDRSTALTRQGDQRIGQAQQRITITRSKGPGRSSASSDQYEYRIGPDGQLQRRRKQ